MIDEIDDDEGSREGTTAVSPQLSDQITPGTIVGGYRIVGKIGSGGMGTVYRALQLSLDRAIALKLLSPDLTRDERARRRFVQEGILAARVGHPQLVKVVEVGESGEWLFLALELIEGETVRAMLDREAVLPVDRSLAIARTCADVLDSLHQAGVAHRDIKPENVFLEPDRGAIVGDLGIARDLFGNKVRTQTGVVVGTPDYLAPELIRGEKPTPASDLYALAAMLFECLAGAPPYVSEELVGILKAHLEAPIPRITRIAPLLAREYDRFFDRALAKRPADRFLDGASFLGALEGLPSAAGAVPGARAKRRSQQTVTSLPTARIHDTVATSPGFAAPARPGIPGRAGRWTYVMVVVILLAIGLAFRPADRTGPMAVAPSPSTQVGATRAAGVTTTVVSSRPPAFKERLGALLRSTAQIHALCRSTIDRARRQGGVDVVGEFADKTTQAFSGGIRQCQALFVELSHRPPMDSGKTEAMAGEVMGELFRVARTCTRAAVSLRETNLPGGVGLISIPIGAPLVEQRMGDQAARLLASLPRSLAESKDPIWRAGVACMNALAYLAPGRGDLRARREEGLRIRRQMEWLADGCVRDLTAPPGRNRRRPAEVPGARGRARRGGEPRLAP
jgi:serine/threonine-protein kinase